MLDRNDVRQALQIINNVANEVQNGRNYLIFADMDLYVNIPSYICPVIYES